MGSAEFKADMDRVQQLSRECGISPCLPPSFLPPINPLAPPSSPIDGPASSPPPCPVPFCILRSSLSLPSTLNTRFFASGLAGAMALTLNLEDLESIDVKVLIEVTHKTNEAVVLLGNVSHFAQHPSCCSGRILGPKPASSLTASPGRDVCELRAVDRRVKRRSEGHHVADQRNFFDTHTGRAARLPRPQAHLG